HEHTDDDEHNHAHQADSGEEHTHTSGQQLRTNSEGVVTIDLPEDGIYYLRTISMTTATDSDKLTHRSKWATLSFEVSHSHDADAHGHEHEHEDEIPAWVFVLGSFLVVGILFLIFRKKK
ncbi:MAG: DUF4198 domain-containing protein, partial [Nonlabens sp.]|nr:DUF4198 domain-containing protein [Nonlabens sp.]